MQLHLPSQISRSGDAEVFRYTITTDLTVLELLEVASKTHPNLLKLTQLQKPGYLHIFGEKSRMNISLNYDDSCTPYTDVRLVLAIAGG
ncbi:MoaD/ThiS family protein [Jonesia quinghaiensis]|uniref:MoaD/ThiS family protein n=1 Tax=Jonesia quinghaiensis TaxID=262806 RepID=UPI00048B18FB|nr:MoaD/ThiS family protein [Jonesia quinghaiensis]